MSSDENSLKRLLAERTNARRQATIAFRRLEENFEVDPPEDNLAEKYHLAADKAERLFKLDSQVNELLFSIYVDDEVRLSQECDQIEVYRDKWIVLSMKYNKLEKSLSHHEVHSNNSGQNNRNLKLFRLQPKKFDGNLRNWIGFWAMFKSIHEDDSIRVEDKFQYLIQLMLEGSPAKELIDSFPPSAANYPKAIDLLKSRFGRTDLLIELYVRELLKLVLIQASGTEKISLRTLYDKIETHLRSLESLGVVKDNFENLLLPLVESALPESVLREWERVRSASLEPSVQGLLSQLLTFLKKEVECEERVNLARSFSQSSEKTAKSKPLKRESFEPKEYIPTAAELVNFKPPSKKICAFCQGSHNAESCVKVHDMSIEDIQQVIKENDLCFYCFRKGHNKFKCRTYIKCIICGSKHNPVLCLQRKSASKPTLSLDENLTNSSSDPILLQTLKVILKGRTDMHARVLIDSGSQRSYITKRALSRLEYEPTSQVKLIHALFGGSKSTPQVHNCYKIRISSKHGNYRCNFDVLDTDTICQAVPGPSHGNWMEELEENGIQLTDYDGGSVDVLIGADVAGKIWTGNRLVLKCGLVAVETLLGWTIMGKIAQTFGEVEKSVAMFCLEESAQDLWRLDILGIEDPAGKISREERANATQQHFLKTVRSLEDGRYEIEFPWVVDHPPLARHFDLALKRLETTHKKLKLVGATLDYENVFLEWLKEDIIEEVPNDQWDIGHYLPHRPVFKEGSTTRIRPVFDASAKTKGNPSLNQCLEKGLNLIELIPSVILRFRHHAIGVIADIRKAFLQISIAPPDRDFVRFLWKRDESGKLRIFRHKRVVFGVTSSPFLLAAVIDYHLATHEELSRKNATGYSLEIISALRKSFYVDNTVISLENIERVRSFIDQATSVFAEAQFDLRGWEFTDPTLENSTATSLLGLIWDRKFDTLGINLSSLKFPTENITRRTLLSVTNQIFDPIGVMAPTTLLPKLLVQQTWLDGGNWDSNVDSEVEKQFAVWTSEINFLSEIKLNRHLVGYNDEGTKRSLHVFCDASQKAYASAIFLRVDGGETVNVHLLEARSRVAPIKKITIPRLELLAATLGARLARNVLKDIEVECSYYYSDSSTVITWIQREEPWNIFVFNRVAEIRLLSNKDDWRHIPGFQNPADLLSRGCTPKNLVQSQWWEGPDWLRLPPSHWPKSDSIKIDEEEIVAERKKVTLSNLACESFHLSSERISRYFSSFHRIIRMIGWMLRFLLNKFSAKKYSGELALFELLRAERVVLKIIQDESFHGLNDKRLQKLKPHIDGHGLIRLRTKIWTRKDSEDFRAPFILPNDHGLVEKLISDVHERNGHISGQGLLNKLREKYWIIRGRQATRRIVANCVTCQKVVAKAMQVESPPLPEARVRDARAFEICGTDFTGPLYLKNKDKVWVCVFTCAVYRAIHLDLVSSLSTEAFMLAFRRFVARRGRPSLMFSDNGTNFRGLRNALSKVDWQKVSTQSAVDDIEWRFNPPAAPWWGGFWERLIGVLKTHLKKILGKSTLSYEELLTVMCDCESFINSRPITFVSDYPSEPTPLTPQMFLTDLQEFRLPDFDEVDSASLQKRIRYRLRVGENLKRRFRSEYLGCLKMDAKGPKDKREPLLGELVLIGSDNLKRINRPMAIVEEIVRGKDGKPRVVVLRTSEGKFTRPIQRVYPLEIQHQPTRSATDEPLSVISEE